MLNKQTLLEELDTTIHFQKRESQANRIRSGQPFLYREGGMESMVIDIRMKESIAGEKLTQALEKTLPRYPYFCSKFVEKEGDFYLEDNPLPFVIKETKDLHSLGSAEVNDHLIDITYNENRIYVSFHHGLCDGKGIMPFVNTLLYYYFSLKNKEVPQIEGIRLGNESLLQDETVEPCNQFEAKEKIETMPKIYKAGYSLPEATLPNPERKTYRYEVTINHKKFMEFSRENNATPAIAVAILLSKAIKKVAPESDQPIVCNMASDLRQGLNLENTFRNCVGSLELRLSKENQGQTFKELATSYREDIKVYKESQNLQNEMKKISYLCDQLDTYSTYEAKKNMLSFFDSLVTDTFVLSYVGQTQLGAYEKYIDSMHMYSSGTPGLTVEMLSVGEVITLNIMQSFEADIYILAMKQLMEELAIDCSFSKQIICMTPKDSLKPSKH